MDSLSANPKKKMCVWKIRRVHEIRNQSVKSTSQLISFTIWDRMMCRVQHNFVFLSFLLIDKIYSLEFGINYLVFNFALVEIDLVYVQWKECGYPALRRHLIISLTRRKINFCQNGLSQSDQWSLFSYIFFYWKLFLAEVIVITTSQPPTQVSKCEPTRFFITNISQNDADDYNINPKPQNNIAYHKIVFSHKSVAHSNQNDVISMRC